MLPALPCDLDERYTLTAELGRGSHAIVYRAIDRHLDREVAVKVLREELLGSDVSERFQREIRLTSKLEHPHIAHVYGTGEFLGKPYFVIALAKGATLGERLRHEHQLPVPEAVSIAKQVASALQHAHSAGIIHRDVKPENILLTSDGALLSDFGVARAMQMAPGTLATSTGTAVGTLLYMSPEQLCAEPDIDGRSDQYALALVLYEMLAGVSAHTAANAEGLRGLRIVGQHAPVRAHRPTVPEHVDAALQQALMPSPADRFSNMAAFIAALDGEPGAVTYRTTASNPTSSTAPAPTRRLATAAAALGTLAIAGVLGAKFWPRTARSEPQVTPVMATQFAVRAEGDRTAAKALATELALWSPEIRAAVDDGPGMALLTRVTPLADGQRVAVQVGEAPSAGQSRVVQVMLPSGAARADSLRILAARVLVASRVSPDSVELPDAVVDRPFAALREYAEGWSLLLAGELQTAEQRFAEAARTRSVPQAVLWQATVATWRAPKEVVQWRDAALAAKAVGTQLNRRDSLLAEAVAHRATDRMPESCAAYRRATSLAGGSFAAWFGLGECLRLDSIVVRDPTSPTGARFRTSLWAAEDAFEQAVARLPADGLVSRFEDLARKTRAVQGTLRWGSFERSSGARYGGLPRLDGDSVSIFPAPLARMGDADFVPQTYQGAIRLLRRRLMTLSAALVRRAPANFAARMAYAYALESNGLLAQQGDSTALTALAAARGLARSAKDSLVVSIADLRVRLRISDFAGAHHAALAALTHSAVDVRQALPVATLIGRTAAAESLLVRYLQAPGSGREEGSPRGIAVAVARYMIEATSGRCDSLASLRTKALTVVQNTLAQAEVRAAEKTLFEEGDRMGRTCPRTIVGEPEDELERAASLLGAGDRAGARAALQRMRDGRDGAAASAVAWDTRLVEIWSLIQAGDTTTAYAQVQATLPDLSGTMDYVLYDASQASGLRRTLAFYDSVARWRGDVASATKAREALRALTTGK